MMSTSGEGTPCTVFLSQADESNIETSDMAQYANMGEKKTILVVDDEESIAFLFQEMLKQLGYAVDVAFTAEQAFQTFSSDPDLYALVLTDQMLPEMKGKGLIQRLLNCRADLPIILCSGMGEMEMSTLKEWGVRSCLQKPIGFEDLARVVKEILED